MRIASMGRLACLAALVLATGACGDDDDDQVDAGTPADAGNGH